MKFSIKRYAFVLVIGLFIHGIGFSCEAMQINSDPNRRHSSEKPRIWKWRNSLTFCVNGIIPLKLGTDQPFSADLAHLRIADIERQFSFEVEQHRDKLRKEIITLKMHAETEKLKIQFEQASLEKKSTELHAQLTEIQGKIDRVLTTLDGAPQKKRRDETQSQFQDRKKNLARAA